MPLDFNLKSTHNGRHYGALIMTNYTEHNKAQLAEAEAWLKANESNLIDHDPEAEGYGVKHGYEVNHEAYGLLAKGEVDAGYWEESTQQSVIESSGIYNVMTSDRWLAVTPRSESQTIAEFNQASHAPTAQAKGYVVPKAAKIDGEKFSRYLDRNAKERSRFCIEFAFKGGAAKPVTTSEQRKARQVKTASKRLARMQKAAEARARLNS